MAITRTQGAWSNRAGTAICGRSFGIRSSTTAASVAPALLVTGYMVTNQRWLLAVAGCCVGLSVSVYRPGCENHPTGSVLHGG